jgi:hypothetical protein
MLNTSQKQKNNNLIVSIPTYIKSMIDLHFADYSVKDREKIYFLIYKINNENEYQIHNGNHSWMLGLNTGEVSNILAKLQNLELIRKSKQYAAGVRSNEYKLVTPYNYKLVDVATIHYYEGQCAMPIWVQKYVADGGIVKSLATTNYKKTAKPIKVKSNLIEKDAEIESLKAEVAHLNSLLDIAENELRKKC